MNIVPIIPTGIGCEIGGHAGDANPVTKLVGACCDNLILHPNVVNSSDVNEMPENSWYVEGSCLNRFLRGEIYLDRPRLNKPVAHGPVDYALPGFHEIVDPRKAIEIVTLNFIHCLLKGLNKASRLSTTRKNGALGAEDVDAMISPMGCLGEPHEACLERGILIVVVRENRSVLHEYEDGDERFIFVENYLEAAGLMMAMKAGIHPASVRRPLGPTTVLSEKVGGLPGAQGQTWNPVVHHS